MNGENIEGFLERLASATPAPAAGAAAALAGAMGAALVAMACRVTARRDAPSEKPAGVEREAEALRARLTTLVEEDAGAVAAVIAARRAPDAARPAATRAALLAATEVPVEIARAAGRVLALCARLAPNARASTVSDLGVAGMLAAAVLDGATLTARVNLRGLDDATFRSRTEAALVALAEEAAATRRRLAEVVAERTGVQG